jgi:sugar-specific transcriptional regulator TrmB
MKSVSFDDEDLETLVNLGLSINQAKIYFTLLSLGCASAKRIAQIMQMDSGDVYRRLEILDKKGLVEKVLHNPIEYIPIPLQDALKALVEPKNKEYAEMQKRIKLLSKKEIKPVITTKEDYSFLIIPQNEPRKQYIYRANKRVEKEWVVYSQIERYPIALTGYYEANKKALDRGVKFRVLLELNKPTDEIVKFLQEYQNTNPDFELRYTDTHLLVSFAIYDKKEMNFSTQDLKGLANSQVLVTDNPQLVEVVYDYFELRWKTAMKEYPKKEE